MKSRYQLTNLITLRFNRMPSIELAVSLEKGKLTKLIHNEHVIVNTSSFTITTVFWDCYTIGQTPLL